MAQSSDSDDDATLEEYVEDLQDEQLMLDVDVRIEKVKVHDKLEYCCETNVGPSWFTGVVQEVKEAGYVKFIEDDDGTVHHNFDLRDNLWKFLK